MAFQHVTGKMGNMRKPDEWIVYPQDAEKPHLRTIQGEKRIARIDLNTGKALLADGKHGNYFHSLSPQLGAQVVDCPQGILDQLKALTPQVGPQTIEV